MAVNQFWVLLLDVKIEKIGRTLQKRRPNLAETDRGSYCNKEEWLGEFLDGNSAFYKGSETDNSDNDDENYHKNNDQQQLLEGFSNSCYKIVSPILLPDLISNFAVCKYCSGTLLLVENVKHSFY